MEADGLLSCSQEPVSGPFHMWGGGDLRGKERYFELLMSYVSHITRKNIGLILSTGKKETT